MAEQLITQAKTVSGNPAAFTTHLAVPLDSCKVHFKPIQEGSGDPSPENVRNIVGWTGFTAEKLGKNLFDKSTITNNTYIVAVQTRPESPVGTITNSDNFFTSDYIKVIPNTQYTFSRDNKAEALAAGLVFFSSNAAGNEISGINLSTLKQIYTFTTPSTCNYIRFSANKADLNNTQIELGSVKNDYEAYNRQTIPIIFGQNKFQFVEYNTDNWQPYYSLINPSIDMVNKTITLECRSAGQTQIFRKQKFMPGTYTASFKKVYSGTNEVDQRYLVKCFDSNNQIIDNTNLAIEGFTWNQYYQAFFKNSGQSLTFTVPDTVSYFYLGVGTGNDVVGETLTISEIQLESGTTASPYVPYSPDVVYGGYVDLVSGEIVAEYEYKSDTWGNIKYNNPNSTTGYQWSRVSFVNPVIPISTSYSLSIASSYCNVGSYSWSGTDNGLPHFYIDKASETDYNAYVILPGTTDDNLVITVVGKLQTPIILATLSPTQLASFIGSNSISSNTNDTIEVTYRDENRIAPGMLAIKERIAANEPHRETTTGDIASFSTDMIAPLTSIKANFLPVQSGSGDPFPPIIESGGIVAANNVKEEPNAKTWEIHFEPKQAGSGTPSPSNVRAISGWTGVEGYQTGKSIVSFSDHIGPQSTFYNGNSGWSSDWKIIDRTKTYTYSVYIDNTNASESSYANVWFKDINDINFVDGTAAAGSAVAAGESGYSTITINAANRTNTYYIVFGVGLRPGGIASNGMVEVGSIATTYEAYTAPTTYSLDWTNEAGEIYGGYVDVVSGKVWKTWKQVDLGTLTWEPKSYSTFNATLSDAVASKNEITTTAICTQYKSIMGGSITANTDLVFALGINNQPILKVQDYRYENATSTEFAGYMNGIYVAYELATPVLMTTLSPTSISLISGKNTFWSNAASVKVTTEGNVRPISGWTGGSVTRCGKNLLNFSYDEFMYTNSNYANGYLNENKLIVTGKMLAWFRVPCKPNTTYTFSYTQSVETTNTIVMRVNESTQKPGYNNNHIKNSTPNTQIIVNTKIHPQTFTTGNNTIYLLCGVYVAPEYTGSFPITFENFQLELGSTATSYQPYSGTTLPLSWETEAGTVYGGYVDLVKGELVATWTKYTFTGQEADSVFRGYNSTYNGFGVYTAQLISGKGKINSYNPSTLIKSDMFFSSTIRGNSANTNKIYVIRVWSAIENGSNITQPFLCGDFNCTTISQFKNWLSQHKPTITYQLDTPIITPLTPQQLKSLRGQNNIWSNLNGTTTATYWTH